MNFFLFLLYFNFFQGFSIKNIYRQEGFRLIYSDLVPLYPTSNLNFYYTFLFIGNPQQKLLILFSFFGFHSAFLCQNNERIMMKGIYNPYFSRSAHLINESLQTQNSLFYILNFTNDESYNTFSSFEDSNICLGSLENNLFNADININIKINCLDFNSKLFFSSNLDQGLISGILNLNKEIIEDEKFKSLGYALRFNATQGILKIITKPFNYEKLGKYFDYLIFVSIEKNEKIGMFAFKFSKITMNNENLTNNDSEWFGSFSTLTNFIQFPQILYENFLREFEGFCARNEMNCLGKKYLNSNYCFYHEKYADLDFFHSFPILKFIINETTVFMIESQNYFVESSKNYHCLGIEFNTRIENTIIFGNYFLLNKTIFFDFQTNFLYLLTNKTRITDFGDLFHDEKLNNNLILITDINSFAIVLPIVFVVLLLIIIIVNHIKRKNLAKYVLNLKINEEGKQIQIPKSSLEISYDGYQQKKLKEIGLETEKINLHEHKESLDRLIDENSKTMTTKPLETIIYPLTENINLESPLS